MLKKKLQVFISSTYVDLKEERQAAVEAILGSRHIPAGMELFKAGNTSQLETIKRWINESDLYMLILGGRYGSIDPESGKSYTQIEYEYAIKQNIPVFAVVLSDSFLHKKASDEKYEVFEKDNKDKYVEFKEFVMTKIIKEVNDCKDIQLAIKDSIVELEDGNKLCGWVRASEVEDCTKVIKENNKLLRENKKLKEQINRSEELDKIGRFEYEKLKKLLNEKIIEIPGKYFEDNQKRQINYLEFIMKLKDTLITGVTNQAGTSDLETYTYYHILPFLVSLDLLEINKVAGVRYRRIEMSKLGLKFVSKLEMERVENGTIR